MPESEKLKGIKQVLETEYQDAVHNGEAQGYLWFVRADAVSVTNRIYLGTRLYGEAEITVPLGQLITNITSADGSITVSLETADNGTTADLKLTLDPDGGLTITENGLAIATANFATKEELTKVNETIATVNDNLVQAVNTLNQNMADGFNTINGGIDNEIRPAIEKNAADIVAEAERAVQAETNLQTNINAETETRKIDVQNLQANINAEVETRKIDVQNLQGNINAEIERAKAAEEDLRNLIAGIGSTTELEQKIDDEVARATAAEEKIRQDVVSGFTVINENVTTIVNTLNKNMSDGFNTINGGINNEIRPAIEKNAEDIKTLNETVATVNDNLVQSVNTLNQNMADGFNTINGGIDNEIRPELEKAVKYDDIATEQNPGRKAITLKNHDMLLGTNTAGSTANIAMINKWDVVDLGTSSLPINMNTPAGVRPTVQEAGQTGEEAHKIAYLSDIEGVETDLENVVKYDDVSTPEKPNRKAIALKNDDLILGATTSGVTVNIAMVNKWDVVDLGSNQLPINLNTPAGVRPTVQEAGQTGEQANQIAYLSDIEAGVQYENIGGVEKNISVGANAGYYATSADGTKQKMMEMDGNAVAIGSESNPLKLQASETPQVVIGTQNKFMVLSDEDDSIATIKQSVETEKVRALAAEKANTDAIGAEVTRATEAEEDLDTRLKVIEESGQTLPNDVALKGRGVNDVPQVDLLKVDAENRICLGSNLGQLRLISKGNPAYVIDGEEKNLATADEIPSTLPNPNALSIKLNGAEVASYDGSAATEADVKVNAENLPMSEEDATTVSTKLSGIQNSVFGEIDVTKFMSENGHTAQFITSLEESYISDLGTPENIDNKPYNASTNNYVIGQSYLVFGKFDDTLTFHYDMYSNATMGFLMRTFMLGFKTLEDKVNTLTEKVAALESAGN